MTNQPLIIVGTHRSGTSMLTRVLISQGIFLGAKRQGDDEAVHFLELNRWIMKMAGTDWDMPLPAADLMKRPEDVRVLADIVRQRLGGIHTRSYFGKRWLAARGQIGTQLPYPWGFKDPRTSITLPLWLSIFPQARVLRIRRHGMDVAASLHARYVVCREVLSGKFGRLARLGVTLPDRLHTVDFPRNDTIDGALGIWSEYESTLDRFMPLVAPERQMTFSYEEYLEDPAARHAALAEFLGMKFSDELPEGVAPDPSRALAWRRKPELVEAVERNAETLARHGY